MARPKSLFLGVLNIKTQPHSPENYYDLFRHLFKIKPFVKIRGSDYGTPAIFNKIEEDPLNGICGKFYKYLEIDPSSPWLDLEKHETILTEDGAPIPQVDKNKRPNAKPLEFVFYPKGHRLFFDESSISPNMAQKFVSSLFSDDRIREKFGVVDVEMETSLEAIEIILKIPTLTKLSINFTRPNDDDLSEIEERIVNKIVGQGVRKMNQTMSSDRNEGIKPDDETIAFMNIAASNGLVTASGYKGGEKVIESTREHPYVHHDVYDPDKQTFMAAMAYISSNILGVFTNRKGK